MLDATDKEALRLFQCDYNRMQEEMFAQTLCEEDVRLFFIQGKAFTDGKNIIVDPGLRDLFSDKSTLSAVEDYLGLNHEISSDQWKALKMITRGQTIHECLHILYSDFPSGVVQDGRSSTQVRRLTLLLIANIIEDAFIEAAGCSVFDNVEVFLQFLRLAHVFSHSTAPDSVDCAFHEMYMSSADGVNDESALKDKNNASNQTPCSGEVSLSDHNKDHY